MRIHSARVTPAAALLVGMIAVSSTCGAVAGSVITGAEAKDGAVAADAQVGGLAGYKLVKKSRNLDPGEGDKVTVICPKGTKVIGSGGSFDGSWDAIQTIITKRGRAVQVYGQSTLQANRNTLRGYAVCGSVVR